MIDARLRCQQIATGPSAHIRRCICHLFSPGNTKKGSTSFLQNSSPSRAEWVGTVRSCKQAECALVPHVMSGHCAATSSVITLGAVSVQLGFDDFSDAWQHAKTHIEAVRTQCTPLRWVVSTLLFVSIAIWSVAAHMIYQAAHTPERATIESPRTAWSSKRAGQIGRWYDWQQQLAAEAAAYEPSSPYDARARLVLLGDSITEAWRGTSYGEPRQASAEVPQVLRETLAKRWPAPLVLAISGDQTQHLLWRLSHGEIAPALASDSRVLVVLLIGTNNLSYGHPPEEVADGIMAVAQRLLNATRGRLLVNTLFPRGDGARILPGLCPPRCAKNGKPLRSFKPFIDRVNALLGNSVEALARTFPDRVRLVDCVSPGGLTPIPDTTSKMLSSCAAIAPCCGQGRHLSDAKVSGDANGRVVVGGVGGGGGGFITPFSAGGGRTGSMASSVVGAATGAPKLGRAVDRAVSGVNEVVGGATRGANELLAGATRGASDLFAAGEEYLAHGLPSDEVRTELFHSDKLHPNVEGHRRWASCLEADIGTWGVA